MPGRMRRPGIQLSHEVMVEEARFVLRTLLREDLFGKRVRLTEAERVIDSSISMSFGDYCAFLSKYGYVRMDPLANVIELTEGGATIAQSGEDPEFQTRLARHFARELGTTQVKRHSTTVMSAPPPPGEPLPRSRSLDPTQGQALADDVLDRRYRRGAALGAGPVGQVFEGEHILLGRQVAIKEARAIFQFVSYLKREEIVRRIKSTVQKQAALQHPCIAQVLDQNHEREFPYFVVELATGGNLRRRMSAAGPGKMPLSVVIRVLMQLLYALRYAHAHGVLHLGIKPENVLFDGMGNVKLSDFGVSQIMDREDGVTDSQIPVLVGSGTVGYFAPERLQPGLGQPVGKQADIYSVGLLAYEMLTGRLPGRRSPLPSQARKDVPASFDDVFDRMTRDDLADRYKSTEEVLAGMYKAFSTKEVFQEGTVLLWANDPAPLPDADEAPEPEAIRSEEPGRGDTPIEITTGEVDVSGARR